MTPAPGPDDAHGLEGPGVPGQGAAGRSAGRDGADGYGTHGSGPGYSPAPQFGAYVTPGQAYPQHPVPGPPHPDNVARAPHPHDTRRRSPVGIRVYQGTPYVTYVVMAVLALAYLAQRSGGLQADLLYWPGVTEHEPWRMLTTTVLHGGLAHLAFNMYALWIAGQALEPIVGRWRLVVLMVLTALGGSTAVLLLSGGPGSDGWITGVVGFSGAVMGLFGAVLAIQRSIGQDTSQLLLLLVINLVIGFIPGWNISWQAHLGGMVVGAVLGLVWSTWRKPATLVAVVSSVVVGLALAATCALYLGAV
ncbi:MAG: rhomboid family intramembrane serine protease [Actinomycetaceae bacterium]